MENTKKTINSKTEWTTEKLKKTYIEFFKTKNHKVIDSASLIPEHDSSVLFTTAGMHPLVPFLMGETHPLGKRIVNCQKCIRTGDIDEVGDNVHLTFFEMMGNWSFGDYFKKESIEMSFEFLTSKKWLGLDKNRLAISVFKGDKDASFDQESFNMWKSLGISEKKIGKFSKKNNWWGPAGQTGPCGPDTEIFYWAGNPDQTPETFNDDNDLWIEIWNNVFMQYNKTKEGKFISLKQKNVDTGLGLERVAMVLQNKKSVYEINTLLPIFELIKKIANIEDKHLNGLQEKSLKIIIDHLRASVFILGDERAVTPSNVDQGYILRRFIRRSIRHLTLLKVEKISDAINSISKKIISQFKKYYPELEEKQEFIIKELVKETNKFMNTIERGMNEIKKKMKGLAIKSGIPYDDTKKLNEWLRKKEKISIGGKWLFDMFQSYGIPPELALEEIESKNSYNKIIEDKDKVLKEFSKCFEEHQKLSRKGAEKKFKGGLADSSEKTKKLHTATHLLNEALRRVLDKNIVQKGSNINAERLRFDFNFGKKLTDDEIKKIEDLVNSVIRKNLKVTREKMTFDKALKSGAQAEFGTKYPEEVWVYSIGDFSKEICMGPHVKNTKELGSFKIIKEESSAAGIRRIKAVLK